MENLEAKSDHDLLLLTAQRTGYVETALDRLTMAVKEDGERRNGRLEIAETRIDTMRSEIAQIQKEREKEDMPDRMKDQEAWKARTIQMFVAIGGLWWLLVKEFRDFFLELFKFTGG